MKIHSFKSIVIVLATSLSFVLSSEAKAAIIQYKIEGTFDTGTLSGLDYLETFTFDDSSKPEVLGSEPWTTEILDYSLEVENHSKHWTLDDWRIEQTFSQWVDTNGFLNSRSYVATPGPAGQSPAFSEFTESDNDDDNIPASRSRHVKWYDWSIWNTIQTNSIDSDPTITVTKVPESSSTFPILGLGILGLGAIVKRHLTSAKTIHQLDDEEASDSLEKEVSEVS